MSRWKHKKIAKERIEKLFEEARRATLEDDILRSNRYVELARKIGMKYNVGIPSKYRRRFCKRCYSYLFPGKTCRVRINKGKLVTKCLNCKTINRFGVDERGEDKHGSQES
ncbi:MAG: ribonuclease P protein component 4 [Candidatus Saliniplasma sp.]